MWGQQDSCCFQQGTSGVIKEDVPQADTSEQEGAPRAWRLAERPLSSGALIPHFPPATSCLTASEHTLQSGKSCDVRAVEATPWKQRHGSQWPLINWYGGMKNHRAASGSFHRQRAMSSHCQTQAKLKEAPVKHLDSSCHRE